MENLENNKLILQSYKLTTIRNDFGIYAQRLIVRIAEKMQYRLEDADFTEKKIKPSDERLIWKFKVTDIADEGTHNYTKIKNELRKVIRAGVYYEISKNEWQDSAVFTDIYYKDGEIIVKINDTVWNLFIEFSKGYKRYELKTALGLNTTYTLRLYQLLSENVKPITYSIDWLKKMFGIEKKYIGKPTDFIKRVIEPAKTELDEKSEMSFTYKAETTTKGKGRPQITGITFYPVKKNKVNFDTEHKEINRKYGLAIIPTEIKRKLKESYEFTDLGIRANADLIIQALTYMENPTLREFLDMKRASAMKAGNPQGWIINAIRKEINK